VQEALLDLCIFKGTINGERYAHVIFGKFFPELPEERIYGWFQQGYATIHTARMFMNVLSNVFEPELPQVVPGPARSLSVHILVTFLLRMFEGQSLER
jgi:hypothetical protein